MTERTLVLGGEGVLICGHPDILKYSWKWNDPLFCRGHLVFQGGIFQVPSISMIVRGRVHLIT